MLHIATVHYGSPRWIEIQTQHLRKHISIPFQTWTSLERIDPAYAAHFDRVIDQGGRHSDKLNHLALEIAGEASDQDLLMFLDGDAFPIADPLPLVTDALARAPLVAVRRAENLDDKQPHPSFCVTTVGAWHKLPGDWSGGYRWVNGNGRRVSDVGGNLLRELELTNTPWVQVLRSNRRNPDPICFGVYGDVIYHHGAGFRDSELSRGHHALGPAPATPPRIPVLRQIVERVDWEKRRRWERALRRRQIAQSQALFERIRAGGDGWLADLI